MGIFDRFFGNRFDDAAAREQADGEARERDIVDPSTIRFEDDLIQQIDNPSSVEDGVREPAGDSPETVEGAEHNTPETAVAEETIDDNEGTLGVRPYLESQSGVGREPSIKKSQEMKYVPGTDSKSSGRAIHIDAKRGSAREVKYKQGI